MRMSSRSPSTAAMAAAAAAAARRFASRGTKLVSAADLPAEDPVSPEEQAEFERLRGEHLAAIEARAKAKERPVELRRTGLIGMKAGMMGMFDMFGQRHG